MSKPFTQTYRRVCLLRAVLVAACLLQAPAATLLHAQPATEKIGAAGRPAQGASPVLLLDPAKVPEKAAAMRDAILAAARTGGIEALRTPLEWNELKPEISNAPASDPIAFWKAQSGDGEGRQILALLVEILEAPPAIVGAGTPAERYIWPGFAEVDLAGLTPALEVYGRAENMLDQRYQEVYGFQTSGLAIYGGMRMTLQDKSVAGGAAK